MNSSIKARQTRLVNWLAKTLNCKPITIAQTGSYYTEFNTLYTGKSVIRISDHLSADRTYIHVILSPLNTTVIVNYRNFIWSGDFTNAKSIIYTLIMSKATIEQANPIPKETTPVKVTTVKKSTSSTISTTITKADYTALTTSQQMFLKKELGYSSEAGWKKLKGKVTEELYNKAKAFTDIITVVNATCGVTKSELRKLSCAMQTEVLGWINQSTTHKYKSIESLPCETIQVSTRQYNTLKPYLNV